MVVSDINLICSGQKEKSNIHIPNANFLCYNRNFYNNDKIYSDRYKFLNKVDGIWYQVYPEKRDIGDYTCEFLDMCIDYNGDERIVFINNDVKSSILDIINTLIDLSPKREVLFFADLQGYSDSVERIYYDVFINMYNDEKLLFNKVYIITDNTGDGTMCLAEE